MTKAAPVLALAIALGVIGSAHAADDDGVLTFHGAPDRNGNFVVPALTAERARGIHIERDLAARLVSRLATSPCSKSREGIGRP